jgi:hypothetical protein
MLEAISELYFSNVSSLKSIPYISSGSQQFGVNKNVKFGPLNRYWFYYIKKNSMV